MLIATFPAWHYDINYHLMCYWSQNMIEETRTRWQSDVVIKCEINYDGLNTLNYHYFQTSIHDSEIISAIK